MSETSDPRIFSFYLSALRELGVALATPRLNIEKPLPLRESLYRIMGTLAIGRGLLLLCDESGGRLSIAAFKGVRATGLELPELGAGARRSLAAHPRPFHLHLPPGGAEEAAESLRPLMDRARLVWVAPLASGRRLVGLLLLGTGVAGQPPARLELEVLEEMVALLALRLEEAHVRRQLDAQVGELRRVNRQLRQIYLETVRALAGVIDGPEPGGGPTHSLRVAALAAAIARRLDLSAERRERLYLAGLLHDIGKQIISREILGKPAPLDPEERRAVQAHPEAGCELFSHLKFPWGDVADIIRHHHERLDGAGYPDRLTGERISLEAKILMMAEAFDSMCSDQPWRPKLGFDQIVRQIQQNLGLQFEPAVVSAMCEAVDAGLDGQLAEAEFVPHLEASFDPNLIRSMLTELRRQVRTPTLRPSARVIEAISTPDEAGEES